MLTRTHIMAIAVLVLMWFLLGNAVAQRQAVPKPQDKLALGEPEVKQLLLLMDTDKSGKISKEEWMKFMEAESDRLYKGQESAVGRQGTPIEVARKPPGERG